MTPEQAWADIERVEVDERLVSGFDREIRFSILGFNLTRELASWTCVAACVMPPEGSWARDDAVLAGHSVRLFKLLRTLLDQVNNERADLMWVVLRMASECAINLQYLLRHSHQGAVDNYVKYSLQREWTLLDEIDENIANRGGEELPIESRMRRSIMRTFAQSGVDPADRPAARIRHWGGKDLRQKSVELGYEKAYLAIFAGPSESVHGNWGDLLRYHLTWTAGRFTPRTDSSPMKRPQPFFAIGVIGARGVLEYLERLDPVRFSHPIEQLLDLAVRSDLADSLHEQYLQRRSSESPNPPTGATP